MFELIQVPSCGQGGNSGKGKKLLRWSSPLWVVSSTFYIVQILVQSHYELVSYVLALEATEPVSEPVTQMTVEVINNHLISVQQKR